MSKPQNATKITAVIVNYFSSKQTQQLVSSLSDIKSPLFDISIVCIDNSNDKKQKKSLEELSQSIPQLSLIFNNENLGFGNAINYAVDKSASQTNFDYLLLINPDVTLNQESIEQLFHATSITPRAGIWGATTVSTDNRLDNRHAWREPSLIRSLIWSIGLNKLVTRDCLLDNYKTIASTEKDSPYPVDSISGCCMLIAKDAWLINNGFDSRFFLYSEEVDFCRRARINGFQPTVVPKSRLMHAISHTTENTSRLLLLHNAKFLYAKIHHGVFYRICHRLIIAVGALIRTFAFVFKNQQSAKSWWKVFCLAMQPTEAFSINKRTRVH